MPEITPSNLAIRKNVALMTEHAEPRLNALLPAALGLDPTRFFQIAVALVQQTPKLGECSGVSLVLGVCKAAQDGLELDGTHATLVPFKGEAVYIPMYQGLVRNALRSKMVEHVRPPRAVFQGDQFEHTYGLDEKLVHVPNPDPSNQTWDKLMGTYCVCILNGGYKSWAFVPRPYILAIQARAKAKNGPWFGPDHEKIGMALKTGVRYVMKRVPKGVEHGWVARALDRDERSEVGHPELVDAQIVEILKGLQAAGAAPAALPAPDPGLGDLTSRLQHEPGVVTPVGGTTAVHGVETHDEHHQELPAAPALSNASPAQPLQPQPLAPQPARVVETAVLEHLPDEPQPAIVPLQPQETQPPPIAPQQEAPSAQYQGFSAQVMTGPMPAGPLPQGQLYEQESGDRWAWDPTLNAPDGGWCPLDLFEARHPHHVFAQLSPIEPTRPHAAHAAPQPASAPEAQPAAPADQPAPAPAAPAPAAPQPQAETAVVWTYPTAGVEFDNLKDRPVGGNNAIAGRTWVSLLAEPPGSFPIKALAETVKRAETRHVKHAGQLDPSERAKMAALTLGRWQDVQRQAPAP